MIQAAFNARKQMLGCTYAPLRPMSQPNKMAELKPEARVAGPVLALDPGQKLVGVAVCDELLVSIRRLEPLKRSNWKHLLANVRDLIQCFDAKTLVVGLPLRLDGTEGAAAIDATRLATNFRRSLSISVFLQDERLTSAEAKENLLKDGHKPEEIRLLIDSESAAIILRDFLNCETSRRLVGANSIPGGDRMQR